MSKWEKFKQWWSHYWGFVFSGLAFIAGFFVGRGKSVSGADQLVEQLRGEIDGLESDLAELRSDNAELAKLSERDRRELERIEIELSETRRFTDIARDEVESGRATADELTESLGGLRELLSKHRKELEKIKVKK